MKTRHGERNWQGSSFHRVLGVEDSHGHGSQLDEALWQQFTEAATPQTYYQRWLALQCSMVADVSEGVVVLSTAEEAAFVPVAFWPEVPRNRQHLAEVVERALHECRGLALRREYPDTSGGPLQVRYHVASPLQIDGRLHGVVALDIAPRPEPHLQAALRQLQWGAAWLEVLYRRQRMAVPTPTQEHLQAALELTATVLEHPHFQAAATAFVTAVATRLTCDRVSVGFVRQGRVHVRAISHNAHFGKKTNLTRALETAMDEAFDQATVIMYPPAPEAPFRITQAHAALARQHGAGAVCSVPLSHDGYVLGVLTLERPLDTPCDAAVMELCEAVAALAGPILELQRREDRWLLTKVAEALRMQLGRLLGPRHVVRKLIGIGVLALCVFFAVARAHYRVAARTVLEPSVRRVVLAPFEGYIATAPVRAGDLVRTGDIMCSLDDRDLRLERVKWRSQREQYSKQYQQALAQHSAALAQIATAQMAQVEAELALVEDHLARAQVRAPFDGMVVTGDLSQSLGAPVERGKVLFEVAPLDAYRVILEVDEREVAEVDVGQRGHLVLSAFPSEPLPFTVEKITPVSMAREGRNFFRIEAQLEHTPARLRPGMEGVGKIAIDQRRLLWIWTHQALDWLRLVLWSWWP